MDLKSFTMIHNAVIRSKKLDVYDKAVYSVIASFNPSFPSYEKIQELTGASRGRVWACLRKLEECNVIARYKSGRKIVYQCRLNSSPSERIEGVPVHFANSTSSPGELETVHVVNPNKNKEKEQRITDFESENSGQEYSVAELIDEALKRTQL